MYDKTPIRTDAARRPYQRRASSREIVGNLETALDRF
jgi:hypothetical protein